MWFTSMALGSAHWASLEGAEGWSALTSVRATETGVVAVEQRTVGDMTCLRGTMTVPMEAERLMEVVRDIEGEPRWSSETLRASQVLGQGEGWVDYYQHLAVPRWTMASDRFWVLRGATRRSAETAEFRWERIDWKARYPDLRTRLARDYASAVEPQTNFGFWRFRETGEGTRATYAVCTTAGGSVPRWIQKRAASQAVPSTMADVAREAIRR